MCSQLNRDHRERSSSSGVTLIEMMLVVALIGLIAAISFPSVSSGLDSLRMTSASDSIVSFLNAALNRAERRQEPIEVIISIQENQLVMRSPEPSFVRTLTMPEGVRIDKIYPLNPYLEEEKARNLVLYPGSAIPRLGVGIADRRRAHRIIRVDPTTGVPVVER
jgi:prepilin-type N-terminal cleavage/methylation domain-containing protein